MLEKDEFKGLLDICVGVLAKLTVADQKEKRKYKKLAVNLVIDKRSKETEGGEGFCVLNMTVVQPEDLYEEYVRRFREINLLEGGDGDPKEILLWFAEECRRAASQL